MLRDLCPCVNDFTQGTVLTTREVVGREAPPPAIAFCSMLMAEFMSASMLFSQLETFKSRAAIRRRVGHPTFRARHTHMT